MQDPLKAKFSRAIGEVLLHEGGYSNDPVDPGGATNWGISLRWLRAIGDLEADIDGDGDVDAADVKAMSREQAIFFYHKHWWMANRYDRLNDPAVATKVFDLAVNMGASQCHKLLQRAVRAAQGRVLVEDGKLGPQTLTAVNEAPPAALVAALRSEAAGFYRSLIAAKPPFEKYRNGWLNRAYA